MPKGVLPKYGGVLPKYPSPLQNPNVQASCSAFRPFYPAFASFCSKRQVPRCNVDCLKYLLPAGASNCKDKPLASVGMKDNWEESKKEKAKDVGLFTG